MEGNEQIRSEQNREKASGRNYIENNEVRILEKSSVERKIRASMVKRS